MLLRMPDHLDGTGWSRQKIKLKYQIEILIIRLIYSHKHYSRRPCDRRMFVLAFGHERPTVCMFYQPIRWHTSFCPATMKSTPHHRNAHQIQPFSCPPPNPIGIFSCHPIRWWCGCRRENDMSSGNLHKRNTMKHSEMSAGRQDSLLKW